MKTPASFTTTETVQAMTAKAAEASDYKAIIRIFLLGGADTHSFVVPTVGNTNLAAYLAARGTAAVTDAETPLNSLSGVGGAEAATWRFHPKMDRIHGLYQAGDVSVMRHVGTLDRPITKSEYLANPQVAPDQIFAHNTQQDIWQASEVPNIPRTTGIFGRLAELVDPYFNASGMSSFTTGSVLRENDGYERAVNDVGAGGPQKLDSLIDARGGKTLVENADAVKYCAGISRLDSCRNVVYNLMENTAKDAFNTQTALTNTIVANATTDPMFDGLPNVGGAANPIKSQCKMALRIISARAALSQRRQTITIGFGGWDHHATLRTQVDRLAECLDDAVGEIWDALVALGLTSNVTIQIETEFGRTMTVNGTGGVDHGWAGHGITIGGAVAGGIHGPAPDYTINGPYDLGQGRYIPRVSTEQFHAPLLRWYGVPESLMPLTLPNSPVYGSNLYAYNFMA